MTGARIVVNSAEVERAAAGLASALEPSNRELLKELAIQVMRGARRRANGPSGGVVRVRRGALPDAGAYPIPVRTGTFGRGFGFRTFPDRAIVFNDARYAGALHSGFRPYGNPHASPIPARPFFDDALNEDLDVAAAHASWEARLQRAAARAGA